MKTQLIQPRILLIPFKKPYTPVVSKESQQVKVLQKLVAEQNARITEMEAQKAKRAAENEALLKETFIEHIKLISKHLKDQGHIDQEESTNILRQVKSLDLMALKRLRMELNERRDYLWRLEGLKNKLQMNSAKRINRRVHGLKNIACRSIVIAKECYRLGLIPYRLASYIFRTMHGEGLSMETIEANCRYMTRMLRQSGSPFYSSKKKTEKRITKQLLKLDHFAPIIP